MKNRLCQVSFCLLVDEMSTPSFLKHDCTIASVNRQAVPAISQCVFELLEGEQGATAQRPCRGGRPGLRRCPSR